MHQMVISVQVNAVTLHGIKFRIFLFSCLNHLFLPPSQSVAGKLKH